MALTSSQVDKLGKRLRSSRIAESDLRLLDEFGRSFREPYDLVVRSIRSAVGLEPVGRPAKTRDSIIQKLERERTRLSRMQDIAGCRVLVENRLEQDAVAGRIRNLFDRAEVMDRRISPSHGYRAIHVVVEISGKLVEIQLRTRLQHLWAQLSEWLSDRLGPEIKYGGGSAEVRRELRESSNGIAELEELELRLLLRYPSLIGLRPELMERPDMAAVEELLGSGSIVRDVADLIERRKRNASDYLIDSITSLSEGTGNGVSD